MLDALRRHWPEYLMEAAGLGIFMISACVLAATLEYPGSPVRQVIPDPLVRRILMGTAMGLTAIAIIFSPWGKQSGAHINPSITVTFFRLGKIAPWDAFFYVVAQFVGALAGVLLVAVIVGTFLAHPSVNYVATLPGMSGSLIAFIAECIISFILMTVVLIVSNTEKLARYTGLFAGALVAIYIIVEAPISGMSMNPARSFGSAVPPQLWQFLWIYFTAPPLGMLLAAEIYLRARGAHKVICAKLHHHNDKRCIFHCGYKMQPASPEEPSA
ncbi:MAG: aquaporin family protein [Nitrospira sp.]|nr:aquaporin family protein [Nitrospira sp.]